jgi:hypothetical protein
MKIQVTSPYTGKQYLLSEDRGVFSCTCPDFEHRSGPAGNPCKHITDFTEQYHIVPVSNTYRVAEMIQTLSFESICAPRKVARAADTLVRYYAEDLAADVLGL